MEEKNEEEEEKARNMMPYGLDTKLEPRVSNSP
jgi:hypothetical protein